MTFSEKTVQLKLIIEEQLIPLIDSDYILLDLPYHTNIGDNLIWEGVESFLKKLPYKCLYRSAISNYQPQSLNKNTIILMMGGGNFGDVWPEVQRFRLRIIQEYSDNPIIILPQTIYYEHLGNLHIELHTLSSHRNLTICARDEYSYKLLKKFRVVKKVLLVPDMAFCIPEETLLRMCLQPNKQTLLLKRIDKEFPSMLVPVIDTIAVNAEMHDWPTVEKDDPYWQTLKKMLWGGRPEAPEVVNEYALHEYLPHMVQTSVKFISQYKGIYTTRLHVGILSVLLHKPVSIIDNSYGKNSQFYDTWLRDIDGVECIGRRNLSFFEKLLVFFSFLPGYLFLCHVKMWLVYKLHN